MADEEAAALAADEPMAKTAGICRHHLHHILKAEALRINTEARLAELKIGFLIMAGLATSDDPAGRQAARLPTR